MKRASVSALILASLVILANGSCFLADLKVEAKQARASAGNADDPGCKTCMSQATSLFAAGKNQDAADLLRSWTARCPHYSQLHLLLSTVLVRMRTHGEEAAEAAARAVAAAPQSVGPHLQYALVLMGNGDNMHAVEEFQRVTQLEPSNYEAWTSLSGLYAQLHEQEKASQAATKAADLEPSTCEVRMQMLKNLERAGKRAGAAAELKRLVSNSEFSPEFMEQLAGEAQNIGDYQDAVTAASRVVDAYPRSMGALKTLSLSQYLNRDYPGALQTSKRMLASDKGSPEALALEGMALVKLDKAGEAEKPLKAALSTDPEQALALLGMGSLQFARGDFDAAGESINHCLDSEPGLSHSPDVCYLLAQTLEKAGDRETSLSYYRKSLSNGLSGAEGQQARDAVQRLQPPKN